MEQGHKEAITDEFSKSKARVFLLTEMVGKQYEIDDPIGGPLEAFRYTALEIKTWFMEGYDRIVELSAKGRNNS